MDVESRRKYDRDYYAANAEKRKANNNRVRQNAARWLKQYKETLLCEVCGENAPECLDFHHRDPAEKKFALSDGTARGVETMLAEIAKCAVLCANCHRKVHSGRILLGGTP